MLNGMVAAQGDWIKEIDGSHLVINLVGKSVNCRYTPKNKKEIFDSRTNATKAIGLAIQQAIHPPELWINAASATIYPHATNEARDESFTDFHNDFSVQVCRNGKILFMNKEHHLPGNPLCVWPSLWVRAV
jgi:NAD dependent epimerase/dehydratase family enzyme